MIADFSNEDKDAPLREDIRFLGRILGDTLREQEGSEAFATVEHIRQLAIRFHRHDDLAARDQLEALLIALPNEHTTLVARAFSYFLIKKTSVFSCWLIR